MGMSTITKKDTFTYKAGTPFIPAVYRYVYTQQTPAYAGANTFNSTAPVSAVLGATVGTVTTTSATQTLVQVSPPALGSGPSLGYVMWPDGSIHALS